MKFKFFIITIIILISGLFIYLYINKCYRKMPEVSNYSIVSNTQLPIPAKLYLRNIKSKIHGRVELVNELVLCFDDTLISGKSNLSAGDDLLYKYLVIIPGLKMIGLVNGMNSLKEKDNYLCQYDEESDNFTSIINNTTFFINPPIKEASFTDKKIIFNTYGVLKKFGESIIIDIRSVPN